MTWRRSARLGADIAQTMIKNWPKEPFASAPCRIRCRPKNQGLSIFVWKMMRSCPGCAVQFLLTALIQPAYKVSNFPDPLYFCPDFPLSGGRMVFFDIKLACVDCGTDFVFTAAEQFYFVTKNFANLPKHCKKCKAKRNYSFRQTVRPVLHETHTNCAECGLHTTVPFTPRQGRPVLCSECFHKQKVAS